MCELDEAWAAAEAALPEGWEIVTLSRIRAHRRGEERRYQAIAHIPFARHMGVRGEGSTPAEALRNLAALIQDRRE